MLNGQTIIIITIIITATIKITAIIIINKTVIMIRTAAIPTMLISKRRGERTSGRRTPLSANFNYAGRRCFLTPLKAV